MNTLCQPRQSKSNNQSCNTLINHWLIPKTLMTLLDNKGNQLKHE